MPFSLAHDGKNYYLRDAAGAPHFCLGLNHIGGDADVDQADVFLRHTGFTSMGYSSNNELRREWPYFQSLELGRHNQWRRPDEFEYVDVFDSGFRHWVDETVRVQCIERTQDTNLIGVFWTDLPQWGVQTAQQQRGLDWVSFMRALPRSAAGRGALERWLANGRAAADFLGQIAARLYADIATALRHHAPGVLSFGEIYWASDMPESVLREAVKHVDVISVQFGPECSPHPGPGYERHFDPAFFERLHRLTGKPLIIADHAVSFPDACGVRTLWHQAASQEEAARTYREFVLAAAKAPYILGYSRCQYVSVYSAWRDTLKQGLLNADGGRYEPYCTLVAGANREALGVFAQRIEVNRGNG